MNNLDCFVTQGVYAFRGDRDYLFVCMPIGTELIGKLSQYKRTTPTLWEKTNVSYFLNCYVEGDIKSVFVDRSNYDMIGQVDNNFELTDDYLIKKEVI